MIRIIKGITTKPLRVCRTCGLEAFTEEDLVNFTKEKQLPHGRGNQCTKCNNEYRRRRYIPRPPKSKSNLPYLRKCKRCGIEAQTSEDLRKFIPHKDCLHGRQNICRICWNRDRAKGGIYYEAGSRRSKKWAKDNPERVKQIKKKHRMKMVTIMGKQVAFEENPRTNICSKCGKRYPEELRSQTTIHHLKYDLEEPLANTIELCRSCHSKEHSRMAKKAIEICRKMGVDLNLA